MNNNRDQVKQVIARNGHPMTAGAIYLACKFFMDQKEATDLLREMENAHELLSFRAAGDAHKRFALPGMKFEQPAVVEAPVVKAPVFKKPAVAKPAKKSGPARAVDLDALIDVIYRHENAMTCRSLAAHFNCSVGVVYNRVREALGEERLIQFGSGPTCRYAAPDSAAAKAEEMDAEADALAPKRPPRGSVAYDTGRRIVDALQKAGTPLSRAFIAESLGTSKQAISNYIGPLLREGEVIKHGKGVWCVFGLPGQIEKQIADGISQLAVVREKLVESMKDPRGHLEPKDFFGFKDEAITFPAPSAKPGTVIGFSMEQINMDAVYNKTAMHPELFGTSETEQVLALLRGALNDDEYRGYLSGNLITLSMRGRPEDMPRLAIFRKAMAAI